MSDLATRLAEARAAHHDLMTGRSALVYVDQNGERVEYQRASADRLAAYIRSLEQQIAGGTRPAIQYPRTSKGL